jgi:hypothetical protein
MALRFTLFIDQGSDYSVTFPVKKPDDSPQDLAGWSARGQVRVVATDPVVLHDFTDELSLVDSDLTLTVPASVSSAWMWSFAAYDVELIDPDGEVTRLVEGFLVVRPEVTR